MRGQERLRVGNRLTHRCRVDATGFVQQRGDQLLDQEVGRIALRRRAQDVEQLRLS